MERARMVLRAATADFAPEFGPWRLNNPVARCLTEASQVADPLAWKPEGVGLGSAWSGPHPGWVRSAAPCPRWQTT